jgi:hypothetical protein
MPAPITITLSGCDVPTAGGGGLVAAMMYLCSFSAREKMDRKRDLVVRTP